MLKICINSVFGCNWKINKKRRIKIEDYFEKSVRTPDTKPTRMSGMFECYENLYNEIVQWGYDCPENSDSKLKEIIYGMGYTMDDMMYHGWTGETANNERSTFKDVENAYLKLLFALEDAIGKESLVYKSHLDENGKYKF